MPESLVGGAGVEFFIHPDWQKKIFPFPQFFAMGLINDQVLDFMIAAKECRGMNATSIRHARAQDIRKQSSTSCS